MCICEQFEEIQSIDFIWVELIEQLFERHELYREDLVKVTISLS